MLQQIVLKLVHDMAVINISILGAPNSPIFLNSMIVFRVPSFLDTFSLGHVVYERTSMVNDFFASR